MGQRALKPIGSAPGTQGRGPGDANRPRGPARRGLQALGPGSSAARPAQSVSGARRVNVHAFRLSRFAWRGRVRCWIARVREADTVARHSYTNEHSQRHVTRQRQIVTDSAVPSLASWGVGCQPQEWTIFAVRCPALVILLWSACAARAPEEATTFSDLSFSCVPLACCVPAGPQFACHC